MINGVPLVELPQFTLYFIVIGSMFWGIILSRLIDVEYRAPWWQFAPLSWISLGLSIAFGFPIIRGLGINDGAGLVIPIAGYASFGALFGAVLRSVPLTIFLGLACAVTYLLLLAGVSFLLPSKAIIGLITQYPSNHLSFLLSWTALNQAAIWIAHGISMGLAVSVANLVLRRDAAKGRQMSRSSQTLP